jgi:hypothetical protein
MRMDHIKVMPPIDTNTPALGRAIRHEWVQDWDDLTVNHRSVWPARIVPVGGTNGTGASV